MNAVSSDSELAETDLFLDALGAGEEDDVRIIVGPSEIGQETVAVVKGDVCGATNVPVRVHSE